MLSKEGHATDPEKQVQQLSLITGLPKELAKETANSKIFELFLKRYSTCFIFNFIHARQCSKNVSLLAKSNLLNNIKQASSEED